MVQRDTSPSALSTSAQSHVLRGMLAPSRIWDIAERAALLPTNDPMIPIVSPLEAPRTAPPEAAASASAASESGGAGSGAGQATGVGSFLSGPMSAGGVPGESALTADLEALRGVAVPLRAISALGFAPLAATMWAGPELLGEDGMNDGLEIGGDPAAAGAAGEPGAVVPLAAAAAAAQTLGMDLYDLVASTEASASAWGPLAAEGSAQASARAVIQRVLLLELAVAAGAPRVANGAAERSYCLPLMHMAVGRWPCGGRPPHGSRAARARREARPCISHCTLITHIADPAPIPSAFLLTTLPVPYNTQALPGAGPSLLTGAWTGRRFGSGFAPSVQKSWLGLSVSSDGLVTGVARDEVGTMQVTGARRRVGRLGGDTCNCSIRFPSELCFLRFSRTSIQRVRCTLSLHNGAVLYSGTHCPCPCLRRFIRDHLIQGGSILWRTSGGQCCLRPLRNSETAP